MTRQSCSVINNESMMFRPQASYRGGHVNNQRGWLSPLPPDWELGIGDEEAAEEEEDVEEEDVDDLGQCHDGEQRLVHHTKVPAVVR